jgi:A/G-specific adenine glycosylase
MAKKISQSPPFGYIELGKWFERSQRVLPWREDASPYRVWISEIMLQQTQVVTVVPYFERFLTSFPTVQDLAVASVDEVMLNWAGLGYYSRARNVHAAAKFICAQGRFPQNREEWLEIPGVGPYTAGAISSIAYDQVEPILDGNVERVLSRLYCLKRERGESAYKESLWAYSGEAVKVAAQRGVRPRVFNQALMELGATVCSPKKPKCLVCPLAKKCEARKQGLQDAFPQAKKKKEWIQVQEQMVALIDIKKGDILMRKREPKEWRAGLWDLPELEWLRKWRQNTAPFREWGVVHSKHVVTRHRIQRATQVLEVSGQRFKLPDDRQWCWVSYRAPQVALGSAPKKVLQLIQERYLET